MKYSAWLVYDEKRKEKNKDYIRMHKEVAKKFDVELSLVVTEKFGNEMFLKKPDFAIVRTINPTFSKRLEQQGIITLNPSFVSRICNDKYLTYCYIKEHAPDVPLLPSRFFRNSSLTRKLCDENKHHVIKAVDGHGGTQVFRTEEDFLQIKNKMNTSDFILQPYKEDAKKDVRVYIIGNEIACAVLRQAGETEFRSNYSLGGKVENYELTKAERNLVCKIVSLFDFGMAGIDFLIDSKGEWIFNEIEDVVGARMLYQCNPGIDFLEQYFSYIRKRWLQ